MFACYVYNKAEYLQSAAHKTGGVLLGQTHGNTRQFVITVTMHKRQIFFIFALGLVCMHMNEILITMAGLFAVALLLMLGYYQREKPNRGTNCAFSKVHF